MRGKISRHPSCSSNIEVLDFCGPFEVFTVSRNEEKLREESSPFNVALSSSSTRNGRDDGNFIFLRNRRLQILQKSDVFLVHENVDEAPDLAVGFTNAVFYTGDLLVAVFN